MGKPPSSWTDSELIDYVELHSKTDRALFHVDDLRRFLTLAGLREGVDFNISGQWMSFHYDAHVADLIKAARAAVKPGPHLTLVP